MRLENELLSLCQSKGITLGLAESCTGGAIAARITKVAGASNYFKGSIVAYHNEAKTKVLGVSKADIEQYGAVSQQIALQMLKGAFEQLEADLALAITGFAGPEGGTEAIPLGTIYIAVGDKSSTPQVFHVVLKGSRSEIIEEACNLALEKLIEKAKTFLRPQSQE